jgi:translation initiation factor IF-3
LSKRAPINHQIKSPEVLVVNQKGESLGKLKISQALREAEKSGLDLVLVAEKSRPPVCRIMDYGKYQYRQQKKERKSRKAGEMKEIRLSLNIEEHDINFKIRQAKKFFKNNHPLKISLTLFGRQRSFEERAREQLDSFIKQLAKLSEIDQPIRKEGHTFSVFLKPK